MHSPRCFPSVKHTTAGSKPTALIHRRVQRPGKAPSFVRKNTCRLPTKGGKKYLFVCYDYCAPRHEEDPQSCKARKKKQAHSASVASCAIMCIVGGPWRTCSAYRPLPMAAHRPGNPRTSCYTVSLPPRSGPHLPGGISINVAEPSNVP